MKRILTFGMVFVLISVSLLASGSKDVNVVSQTTASDSWVPTKKINWVVPFEAGGNSDIPARVVAKYMSEYSAFPVEITNIDGAGGRAGVEAVRKLSPDGYSYVMQAVAFPMQYSLGIAKFTYEDFEPVTQFIISSLAVVVNAKSGWTTLDDLVAAAKANPGKIKVGSRTGTLPLFAIIDLQNRFDVQFNIVDLTENKAPELLSGRIDAYIDGFGAVKQYIDSKDFNCLAIISDVDVPGYEHLTTYAELGLKGYEFLQQAFGIWAPKGTPRAAVEYVNNLVKQANTDPKCIQELNNLGVSPSYMTIEEYTQYMADTYEAFQSVVKSIL